MSSSLNTLTTSSAKNSGLLILLSLYIIFHQNLLAQPGTLDKSFGLKGIVIDQPGVKNSAYQSIALQPDAKIVTAGYSTYGQYLDFSLARYDTNGVLDESFGNQGKVTTIIGPGNCVIRSLNIQPDGKMIVAGYAENGTFTDFALARYNTDGSLDNSFGMGGIVSTSFDFASASSSSALQPDGKIIVAGYMGFSGSFGPAGTKFALARYYQNGTLDSTFGTNGKVSTAVRDLDDAALSMGIQSDGKIVLGGWSYRQVGIGNATDIALVRYNTNGTLDTTFGLGGKVITEVGLNSQANKLLTLDNNKVVVCGCAYNGSNYDFALVKYNNDGTVDTSWGINGIITTSIGLGNDYAIGLILQSDKKLIVSGSSSDAINGTKGNFTLARYNIDGSMDNTFGSDGIVVSNIDTNSSMFLTTATQIDGKILAAGSSRETNSTAYSVLARYLSGFPNGLVDLVNSNNSLSIYPNPTTQKTTLEYTLKNAGIISVYLFNSLGKFQKTFLSNMLQQPGKHFQEIVLSSELANGNYWIVLSTSQGKAIKSLIINN